MSEPVPRDRLRASDGERETVVAALRDAHSEGRLTLAEFDERVQAVWVARTYGDLGRVLADLPSGKPTVLPADLPPAVAAPRDRSVGQRKTMRFLTRAWFVASAVNLAIWVLVCLSDWQWVYPWWVWVAGPWGAAILAGRLGGFGGRPQREQ